ncbi:MAG: MBL fold metallo-hydrolase [Pseudoflavonifractor sp.]
MQIKSLVLGEYGTNCYIVSGGHDGSCLLIDPADNGPILLTALEQLALTPVAVLLTHGHYDHILAVPALQDRWSQLPVYCHPLDCPKALVEHDMGRSFPTVSSFSHLLPLSDGQQLCLGGFSVSVLHTPGHTPGSCTLQVEDALFTGDTLFREDIGRTDFEGGNMAHMNRSLARLAALPGDYRVFPGHEEASTLDHERRHNPMLIAAQASSHLP